MQVAMWLELFIIKKPIDKKFDELYWWIVLLGEKSVIIYGYVYLVKTSLAELRTRNSVFSTRQGVTSRYTLAPQNKKK